MNEIHTIEEIEKFIELSNQKLVVIIYYQKNCNGSTQLLQSISNNISNVIYVKIDYKKVETIVQKKYNICITPIVQFWKNEHLLYVLGPNMKILHHLVEKLR